MVNSIQKILTNDNTISIITNLSYLMYERFSAFIINKLIANKKFTKLWSWFKIITQPVNIKGLVGGDH